jgi:3-hydroxybutyryl-CoA dehydrogenase
MTRRIAIIGAGLMGSGIAAVFASSGHHVTITDAMPASLGTVMQRVASMLHDMGKPPVSIQNLHVEESLATCVGNADLVIEAAPEKLILKQDLFTAIEASAPRSAILASNTSVIPITQIMQKVTHKARALGTHWWNPPYLVPLVEVIQTADTDPQHITDMMQLLTSLGKFPVHVKKDVPGFVGNRLQHALWREAISLVENGVCDAQTVDDVVKNSFGTRLAVLGPLENADLVGTDLTLDIHTHVLASLEDIKSPSPYLENLVREGKLGFKSHQGFKHWTDDEIAALRTKIIAHLKRSFT